MKYRKLGRTEVMVSELVFGCGNVGGIMIHSDPDTMHKAVTRALDAGINWFDTAPQYGNGNSERNLGHILKDIPENPFISTKVKIDPENRQDIYGQIEKSLHESLDRLKVDYIDLYQLHNGIESQTKGNSLGTVDAMGREGAFDAMEKLRAQGLIKWIGMTALGDTALCRLLIKSRRIDTAQVYYNMVNPTAEHGIPDTSFDQVIKKPSQGHDFTGLLDTCSQNDVGIIVIRALAAGLLASDVRHGRETIITQDTTIFDDERKSSALHRKLGAEYGTRAQTALRFVLSHPAVSCIDFGIGELSQLDEALVAVEMGKLPDEVITDINSLYEADYGKI